MQSENLIEDEKEDDAVCDENEDNEKEEESGEEDSQILDSSETYSIDGKTSYAAFMDRLDDVSNLSCPYHNYSEIIPTKDCAQIFFTNIFL